MDLVTTAKYTKFPTLHPFSGRRQKLQWTFSTAMMPSYKLIKWLTLYQDVYRSRIVAMAVHCCAGVNSRVTKSRLEEDQVSPQTIVLETVGLNFSPLTGPSGFRPCDVRQRVTRRNAWQRRWSSSLDFEGAVWKVGYLCCLCRRSDNCRKE